MQIVQVTGWRPPQVKLHDENPYFVAPTPPPPFGASQYGMAIQQLSGWYRSPQIKVCDGDTPELSTPVTPLGAHYIPVWRRRRR